MRHKVREEELVTKREPALRRTHQEWVHAGTTLECLKKGRFSFAFDDDLQKCLNRGAIEDARFLHPHLFCNLLQEFVVIFGDE
jgi:hypothetical protein